MQTPHLTMPLSGKTPGAVISQEEASVTTIQVGWQSNYLLGVTDLTSNGNEGTS